MDTRLILVLPVLLFALSACATTSSANLCTAGPIILSKGASERLTRSEKEQIITLNFAGVKVCGWEVPK